MDIRSAGRLATALFLLCGPASAEPDSAAGADLEWRQHAALRTSAGDFATAVAAQRRGDLDAAAAGYAAAIANDPTFVEALVNLARVQVARGEFAAAATSLDAAAAERGDYPGIHAARGLLALESGDPTLAVDALSRARAGAPNDVETLTNLGAALLARGMNEQAIPVLEHAQRLDPRRAAIPFNLGLAHDRLGESARALHHYRRCLALSPRLDPGRAEVEKRVAELTGASGADSAASTNPLHSLAGATTAATGGMDR